MRTAIYLLVGHSICLLGLAHQSNQTQAANPDSSKITRPNIIYILADDLGYGDLGCYGSQLNRTPNIDALARSGSRFTDFHAAPWCAPSRRALMTGCHASRPWTQNSQKWGRLASAITIPEMLKANGYATAIIGKWHLEMSEGLHPLDQGFDYWFGTRGSNDWDGPRPNYQSFKDAPEEACKTPLFVNRENKGPVVSQSQFIRKYTEETIRLIEKHKGNPFFIYVAHNMPHVPIFASTQFKDTSTNGIYGDVVSELDWSVGQIVLALNARNLLKQTIVVFTSDNGPWTMFREFGGKATPLRGEKSTTWEGGERVPFVASWPDQIRPHVCSELTTNYDVYATIAKLTSSTIAPGQAIDSLDFSEVLLERKTGPRKRHISYFHGRPMALRNGRFKLHAFTRDRTRDPETGSAEPSVAHEPPLLFDLKDDVSEQTNIANRHPDIAKRMQQELLDIDAAIQNWRPY